MKVGELSGLEGGGRVDVERRGDGSGLQTDDCEASGERGVIGRPCGCRWVRYGDLPLPRSFFRRPRTVAVPVVSGAAEPCSSCVAAFSRSNADSTWSQSSSPSSSVIPLGPADVAELGFDERKSSEDCSLLPGFALFFWPMRKMDARDGRRGDDLWRDMDVPYGEVGCLSFSRVDFIDSGPVLVFARRL